jgi:hypothetical protein
LPYYITFQIQIDISSYGVLQFVPKGLVGKMNTEMGEYLVGAYLKLIYKCDVIDFNVRRPGGGLAGLNEIDVIGLDFKNKIAYVCEVTTHLDGTLYGSNMADTVEKLQKKYNNLQGYAKEFLTDFSPLFIFWSPVVTGRVESELQKLHGLELIINKKYTEKVEQLKELAKHGTHDTGNPAFRVLQILGHLK